MGVPGWLKSVGNFLNKGLKKSKVLSTVAGTVLPGAVGKVAQTAIGNLGYAKGGRVKPRGMKKGGKVGRPKKKAGRRKK